MSPSTPPTPKNSPSDTVINGPQRDDWRDRVATRLIRALGHLPLRFNRWLGSTIGRSMRLCRASAARTTQTNLSYVWDSLSADMANRAATPADLAKHSLKHMGKTATEMTLAWTRSSEWCLSQVCSVQGQDILDQALAEKKGVIILAPHLGNWEFLIHYIGHVCPSITALYQPAKFQRLDKLIHDARQRCTHLAPTNRQGVMRLLKALKKGEAIGILPDQIPLDGGGEYAPFFGKTALTMTLVRQLQRKTGAQVVSAFARRVSNGFVVEFLPADERLFSEDDQESIIGLNASVEACVRRAPEQYQWEYKRYRRMPDHVPNVY